MYKRIGDYDVLITDYTGKKLSLDLLIVFELWIKNNITDVVIFRKMYKRTFFCPKIEKIDKEIAKIIDGVKLKDKLSVCFDTCHVNDAGYDIVNNFEGVIKEFDRIVGIDRISVIHLNDSKNPRGAMKDRHENLGFGTIGFEALNKIAHYEKFSHLPKILETPYVALTPEKGAKTVPPYKFEIEMLKNGKFDADVLEKIKKQ